MCQSGVNDLLPEDISCSALFTFAPGPGPRRRSALRGHSLQEPAWAPSRSARSGEGGPCVLNAAQDSAEDAGRCASRRTVLPFSADGVHLVVTFQEPAAAGPVGCSGGKHMKCNLLLAFLLLVHRENSNRLRGCHPPPRAWEGVLGEFLETQHSCGFPLFPPGIR